MTGGGRSPHVAVVGGGISGLAAAYRLRALLGPAARITLIERSARLGGVLRTVDLAGAPMDVGAEAFLARRPEVPALAASLGLTSLLVSPSAASATVRAGGRTVPLPRHTVLGVPGSAASLDGALSASALARVAAERDQPLDWDGADRSVGALLRARFGDELADRVVDPLLSGVYAGRVDGLGLRATMPALAAQLDAGAPSLTAAADRLLPPPPPRVADFPSASRGFSQRESGIFPARVGIAGSSGSEPRARPMRAGSSVRRPGGSGASGVGGSRMSGGAAEGTPAASPATPVTRPSESSSPSSSPPPVFGALHGGYQVLLDALCEAAGAEVRLGMPVRGLVRRPNGWRLEIGAATAPEVLDVDAVLLAVPAPALRRLLADVAPAAARAAGAVELASPVVVALAYRAEDAAGLPDTSGLLIAADEPLHVKAFTHSSRKWPHLAPEATDGLVRLRASLGRAGEATALRVPDEELVTRVRTDLATLTGITVPPVAVHVQRHGGGLPQYAVGHVELVARLEAAVAALPGLAVAGALLHGVGVPACLATAATAAERIAAELRRSTGPRAVEPAGPDSR